MKQLFVLILTLALSWAATAQDIHFSQFYQAPLELNPAMTGVMNCQQRIGLNYRNQWASVLRSNAFQTYNVAYDSRIAVGRYDYFGLGGSLWSDLDFSYAKRMGGYRKKASYLVMGAEVGMGSRGIDYSNARWGNQAVNGVYDPTAASGETIFQRDNFLNVDVSAGLLWFSVIDDKNNFYIGGAYDHINRANVSYAFGKYEPLRSKFTVHAGGEFQLADRMTMLPGAVTFLQGAYMQVNAGTSLRFLLGNSRRSTEALQFGLWTRLGNKVNADNKGAGGLLMDAVIVSTRFDYDRFSLGFSYDLNTSTLRPATRSNGGFEFSMQYKICGPERRNVFCPNF
jgi:type IX secretion system PorP/SprF family membrane protein